MSIDHNNMRRLDLNLLLAFDALMRKESVSAAADCLSLGQPAMSHSLRRLRGLFGDDLLVREGGGLRPTDRAVALWAPIREALEGLETGLEIARGFDPAVSERVFRVSLPDYLAADVLRHFAVQTQTSPSVKLRVDSLDRDAGREALISGELDAYVGVMPPSLQLIEEPLFQDDFVTLFDPALWRSPPDTLDAFCAAQHLLVAQIDSFEGWVDTALSRLGQTRQVVASVARFGDAISTLPGSSMLVTLPRRAAEHAGMKLGLACCAPAVGKRSVTINIYRRRRAIGAPASEWLNLQISKAFKLD